MGDRPSHASSTSLSPLLALYHEALASPAEKQSGVDEILRRHSVQIKEGRKLEWDTSSPHYPRNYSSLNKLYAVALISWLEAWMTAISSSGTATADAGREEYGISRTMGYFAFVSIYLIGQTIGGIVCSPISEIFGRRSVYLIGTVLFCVASIITASIPSLIAVFFGRFFQGLASAIPATVAFGSLADLFDAQERIWMVYVYTLTGMIGLAAGPIYSTYVTSAAGWKWVYWISAIVTAVSSAACLLLKESNADQLLEMRVKAVRQETGDDNWHSVSEHSGITIKKFVQTSLWLPLRYLVTEPVVFLCAVLCAIAFSLAYSATESLSIVYTAEPFAFSMNASSLPFIAIIIGELLNVLPRIYDHHLFLRYRKQGKRILPETKIRSFAIACPSLAIGLWIFAWTIPPRVTSVPWPVSCIGLALLGFTLNDFSYVLFGYATDSYGPTAASAVAAISLTRTAAAAALPLFTYQMYTGLGSNVATSIFAAVATLFAFTPILFLGYGARLRRKSKAASNDEDALAEENDHLQEKQGHEKLEKA